jgi:hypothetical protein
VKKSVFKHRSTLVSSPSPSPSCHCPLNKRKTMGLGQGSLVWQNRWHIVCRKHRRLGFDTRGTPKRLKQKRVKNWKVEFSEKAEKFVRRKGVCEVGSKSGFVFSTQSHANNLAKTEARTGTLFLSILRSCKTGTGWGGGGGGRG